MNIILSILCCIFLITTIGFGVHNYNFLKDSIAIQGKVIDVDRTITRSSSGNRSQNSYPIIEYINPLEQKKQFKGSVAALNIKIGSKVWVAYNKKKEKEKIISLGEIFLPSIIFALFGIVLLLLVLPLSINSQIMHWFLKLFNIV